MPLRSGFRRALILALLSLLLASLICASLEVRVLNVDKQEEKALIEIKLDNGTVVWGIATKESPLDVDGYRIEVSDLFAGAQKPIPERINVSILRIGDVLDEMAYPGRANLRIIIGSKKDLEAAEILEEFAESKSEVALRVITLVGNISDIPRGNLIVIGGPLANPLTRLLEDGGFIPVSFEVLNGEVVLRKGSEIIRGASAYVYALRNPSGGYMIVVAGSDKSSTLRACEYLVEEPAELIEGSGAILKFSDSEIASIERL